MSMRDRLAAFAEAHPEGWSHDEWLGLLAELEREGHDVGDRDRVGLELEKERLRAEIRRRSIKGMGPKRTEAVVDRYQTLWNLRHASVADVASTPNLNRTLAEKLVTSL